MNTSPVSRSNSQIPRGVSRLEGIPWLALASLLAVLICIGASISIIVTSDTQIVESWAIQPAVLLAILASVSSIAVSTAFSAAVVVTWWTSAVEGASLAQLHYIWDRGEGISFFSAIAAGANARRVVLTASIIVAVKLVTNPLMQRATHQTIDDIATRGTIKLNLAQSIPQGWLAESLWNDSDPNPQIRFSMQTIAVLQGWWKKARINSLDAPGYHCDGTCEGNVPGVGIHYNCSSTTHAYDIRLVSDGTVIFGVNATMSQNSTGAPFLLLTTLYTSAIDDTCTATLTIDTCKIEAGIVEYPVIHKNSTITLDSDKLNNVSVLSTYIYPEDLRGTTEKWTPGIGPLLLLNGFCRYLTARMTASHESTGNSVSGTGQLIAASFLQFNRSSSDTTIIGKKCGGKWWTWSSPTNYVLNSMQNIMFRAVLGAANATEVQTFTVRRTKPEQVFHSTYGYLVAASATTLLGVLGILIMLQGWWVLGRTITLSPLETAKAFGAPLMEHPGSNVTVEGILGDVEMWVKYADGVMTVYDNRDVSENHDGAT